MIVRGIERGGDWLFDEYHHAFYPTRQFPVVDTGFARMMVREAAIREALGRWVSELEPCLVFNEAGHFVGLALDNGGWPREHVGVVVAIRGGVPI